MVTLSKKTRIIIYILLFAAGVGAGMLIEKQTGRVNVADRDAVATVSPYHSASPLPSAEATETQEAAAETTAEAVPTEAAKAKATAKPAAKSDTKAAVPKATAKSSSAKKEPVSGKININTASKEELMKLSGIGDKLSDRIIAYRDAHGGFADINELKNVSGIGDKSFEKLRDYICTE